MSAVERELQRRLSRLGPAEKAQVLEYTRALGEPRQQGTPGRRCFASPGASLRRTCARWRTPSKEDASRSIPMAGSLLLDTSFVIDLFARKPGAERAVAAAPELR